jgi:hypothetical protein
MMSLPTRLLVTAVFTALLLWGPPTIEQAFAPEPMAAPARVPSPAPIYSKRCAAQGRDFIAHQRDGWKWVVHCVKPAVRT